MKIRKAFVMSVNPGSEHEYENRHNPIWPDLEKVLKDHGVSNYSIFLDPETHRLFGYAEVEDEEQWAAIAPTLLELAGVPAPDTLQGESFVPILRDPAATVRTHAFAEHNWHVFSACERAVITDRFNYIRNWRPDLPATPPPDIGKSPTWQAIRGLHAEGKLPPSQAACLVTPRPEEELYDTEKDPYALKNLAQDPHYEPVMDEMRAALAAWQRETGDKIDPDNIKPDGLDRETFKKRERKKSAKENGEDS
jgi:N-sulfoglucosamine sulfohydrolase